MIAVLETVIQSDNPVRSIGRIDKRCRLQHVTFSTDVAFLAFAQHVSLPELWSNKGMFGIMSDV